MYPDSLLSIFQYIQYQSGHHKESIRINSNKIWSLTTNYERKMCSKAKYITRQGSCSYAPGRSFRSFLKLNSLCHSQNIEEALEPNPVTIGWIVFEISGNIHTNKHTPGTTKGQNPYNIRCLDYIAKYETCDNL